MQEKELPDLITLAGITAEVAEEAIVAVIVVAEVEDVDAELLLLEKEACSLNLLELK